MWLGASKYRPTSEAPTHSSADFSWETPDHGPALRIPPLKQAKTARGHTFCGDTIVYHESELEQRVATILQAHRDVLAVYSQYPKVQYVDAEGVVRSHTFDFLIIMKDGRRIAVAVKNARKKLKMLELLDRIRAAGISSVAEGGKQTVGAADAVMLVTEQEADRAAYENATSIISARLHHDEAECSALHWSIRDLPGRFRFGELLAGAASRPKRRTAIWRLIDLGILEPVARERIGELSWLCLSSCRPAN